MLRALVELNLAWGWLASLPLREEKPSSEGLLGGPPPVLKVQADVTTIFKTFCIPYLILCDTCLLFTSLESLFFFCT